MATAKPAKADSKKTDRKEQRKALQLEFARLQRQLLETDVSLIVLLDGWESSGKGRLMRDLVRRLDPRYYEASVIDPPTADETKNVLLWRFWRAIPRRGRIAVLNHSWYSELLNDLSVSPSEREQQLKAFRDFEKTLRNDGMVVIKFFLQQSKRDMKTNIKKLKKDPDRRFLVSERDEKQLADYDDYAKHFASILDECDAGGYGWTIIESSKKKPDAAAALTHVLQALGTKLQAEPDKKPEAPDKKTKSARPVSSLDLDEKLSREEYDRLKKPLQEEAGDLLYRMYTRQKAAVLAFEGTDAAGKGGAIRRLVADMDPRGYDIATTAAPDATEQQYNHLWRFMRDMPQNGKLTVFDRSWYGRVLVERIESLTPESRWLQGYDEINAFEHHLVSEGRLVLKFLIVIDKDEQKRRFDARAEDPDKTHKLTDEDWRNREKFDQYLDAMDDMVVRTSTDEAPWIVIPGTDKRYARIAVLQAFVRQARDWLEKDEKAAQIVGRDKKRNKKAKKKK